MFSGFSRRQLLKLMSGLIAGAAAVGSIPFISKLFVSKAQAQDAGEQKYKGRTFRIVRLQGQDAARTISADRRIDQPVELYLDGEPVTLLRNRKTGRYTTNLLFEEFKSPQALAKELIDLDVVLPTGQLPKGRQKI